MVVSYGFVNAGVCSQEEGLADLKNIKYEDDEKITDIYCLQALRMQAQFPVNCQTKTKLAMPQNSEYRKHD